MSRRYLAITAVLTGCVMLAAVTAAQQPRIANARLTPQAAGTDLARTFGALVGSLAEPAWIGYTVPARDPRKTSCCWSSADGTSHFSGTMTSDSAPCCGACRLEPAAGGPGTAVATGAAPPTSAPIKLEGSDRILVLVRVANGAIDRVRTFSEDCQLDAGGRQVHWLQDVGPADSVALLESLVREDSKRAGRVATSILQALSQHAEPSAPKAIERLARSHPAAGVRGDALFWLAQMAGEKVAGTITASIENDPDTEVKRRAVFALSQLPKDEGVPLLIDVARRNRNAVVRKQAMFWLGQSKDPRALEFFAEILK